MFFNLTVFAQVEYEEPCIFTSDDNSVQGQSSSPCVPSGIYSGSIDPDTLATYSPVSYNLQVWINNKSDGKIVETKNLIIQ